MPTVLNLNEAKTNFSNVIANVENNLVTVTIMRYGHPIAQIVPCPPKRKLRKDPLLAVLPGDDPRPGESFPVAAFAQEEFLMPSLGFDLDILPVFGSDEAAVEPRLRYTNLDDAAIVSMVEHGLGLTILSELVMKSMNASVRVLPLDPPAWREIGMLSAQRRQENRALGRFLRCAERTLHTMYEKSEL